jgi:DNA-binding protein YbaB
VAKLQAQVEAVREIQRIKEAIARQMQREAADLKKKLEDAKRKAKDAATIFQIVIDGKFPTLPRAGSVGFTRSHC